MIGEYLGFFAFIGFLIFLAWIVCSEDNVTP